MRWMLFLAGIAMAAPAASAAISIAAALPPGTVGTFYSQQLTASGGVAPYTWSASSGLPPGLSLTSTGVILGTPTTAGHYTFTVTATDLDGTSGTQAASITIGSGSGTGTGGLSITTAHTLPAGTLGQIYSQTLAATGGSPPYQWSVGTGLPAGLTLTSSGTLSGTPTASGSFTFSITVTDSANNSAQASFTMTVGTVQLTITTSAPLFTGVVGSSYAETFTASGGAPPYTWTVSSGSTGSLTLNSTTGTLSGTPAAAGTLAFTVQVTDTAGNKANQSYTITVQASTLVLSTGAALPAGTMGAAYNQTISASASGGAPPYTWSLSGLPGGLSFNVTSLAISGTPTAAGTFPLTLQVTDSAGSTAQKSLSLVISSGSLTITTARQLAAAVLSTPFSESMTATGGTPPYTWSAAGLPAGLAINPTSGLISGTPTAAGTFNPVVLTVTDSALQHYSDNFTMTVSLPAVPAMTFSGLPATAQPAQQYPLTVTLASAYTANITGQAILSFSPTTGLGDSTIAFASGGTTASFNIPVGSLTAVSTIPLAIQTGTAAGTIHVSLRLQAGGVDITPVSPPSISTTIGPAAPVISATQVTRTSNSLTIAVTGYATDLEVTQAVFTFTAAAGQTLQSAASTITLDVTSLFSNWFTTSTLGGEFEFTQPFTIQGDPTQVIPQTVTLTNRVGSVTVNVQH